MSKQPTAADFLRLSDRVRVLPIIHGSGDFAVRVRAELLERPGDCLAVPLPPSFQDDVEEAVRRLPIVSCVVQRDAEAAEDREEGFSFVPIDPCQGVIPAIRLAMGEHVPRAFVDIETPYFEPFTAAFPDPYALKKVSIAGFAAAVLPSIPPPDEGQHTQRVRWMVIDSAVRALHRRRLHLLAARLAWVRQAADNARHENVTVLRPCADLSRRAARSSWARFSSPPSTSAVGSVTDDENLSIDGVTLLRHASS
jgi:hypothetical protein